MKKEDLIGWGLTEEQAKKVLNALDGDFVAKTRFDEVSEENKTLKQSVAERDKQLETLKKASGDTETLKEQIAALQEDNRKKDEAHAAELHALKLNNAVELALTGAKAKNNLAAKALLGGFLEKAELAEDGTVKGLAEEIKRLSDGKDTAFLFEKSAGGKFKGAKPAEKGDDDEGGMTLERLKALTPAERHSYSISHPEEYKDLYGGNA